MGLLKKISNYWLYQFCGWGLVGLSIFFFAYTFRQQITGEYILKIIVIVAAGICSTHLLRIFMKKNRWLALPVEKILARLAIAVILTSILFSLMVMGLNGLFDLSEASRRELGFTTRLLGNILDKGIFIIPWVLFYYFYHYLENNRRQQLDTLKLEALVKELELKTIKSHINPHFIFNALNSIRALIDEDPRRARNAITGLSNILRSSMQSEKMETVPFERELNIVKDYLALEYIRFEDRLKIEYDINEQTLNRPVPPMMLQTLVENAIKHGIGRQVNGGVVKVISGFKEEFHELIVQNSGKLNGQANPDGFGLSSTRNRLHLLFGEKALFEIWQNGSLVEARVLIPMDFK
ncbi:MAG: histidine kinase [Chitinophagaceae bacterium]|nr:histidine kinase [Chitinophagaceae bacterium]